MDIGNLSENHNSVLFFLLIWMKFEMDFIN